MTENDYQAKLIKKIGKLLPDSVVLKNDAQYKPGFPDLTILNYSRWAVVEVKISEDAPFQPNQEWYLRKLHGMSFSAVIYPENESEVLHALQQSLTT